MYREKVKLLTCEYITPLSNSNGTSDGKSLPVTFTKIDKIY